MKIPLFSRGGGGTGAGAPNFVFSFVFGKARRGKERKVAISERTSKNSLVKSKPKAEKARNVPLAWHDTIPELGM